MNGGVYRKLSKEWHALRIAFLQVGDLKMVLGKEVEPRTSTSCNHVGPRVLDAQRDIGNRLDVSIEYYNLNRD